MKFKCFPKAEWTKWFAWHPVWVQENKIVWLEWVYKWYSPTANVPRQYKENKPDENIT